MTFFCLRHKKTGKFLSFSTQYGILLDRVRTETIMEDNDLYRTWVSGDKHLAERILIDPCREKKISSYHDPYFPEHINPEDYEVVCFEEAVEGEREDKAMDIKVMLYEAISRIEISNKSIKKIKNHLKKLLERENE